MVNPIGGEVAICCKVRVHNGTPAMLSLLEHAGFELGGFNATLWTRKVEAEGTVIQARADLGIIFSLSPSVSTFAGHTDKRLSASLMFQVAALLAEKCGGIVTQESNVIPCSTEAGASTKVIADYPARPLLYDQICPGFRAVLLPAEG